jgi:hypothetical protein
VATSHGESGRVVNSSRLAAFGRAERVGSLVRRRRLVALDVVVGRGRDALELVPLVELVCAFGHRVDLPLRSYLLD